MKKWLTVMLMVCCAMGFSLGDAFARPKKEQPPKVDGEKVNGVARINASGDIIGTVQLSDCPAAPQDTTLATFRVLVYVPGQSITAVPTCDTNNLCSFVLYNVPEAEAAPFTVDVTADAFVPGKTTISTATVPVIVNKHLAVTLDAPIPLACPQQ